MDRNVEICPDVMYGFWRGFVRINERYYRAPTDSSMERIWRIIRDDPSFKIVWFDQTFEMGTANIQKEVQKMKTKLDCGWVVDSYTDDDGHLNILVSTQQGDKISEVDVIEISDYECRYILTTSGIEQAYIDQEYNEVKHAKTI